MLEGLPIRKAAIIHGDRVLIMRRKEKEGDEFSHHWELPGGTPEILADGTLEPYQKTLAREVWEETGLSGIKILKKIRKYTFSHKGQKRPKTIHLCYLPQHVDLHPEIIQSDEHDDAKWVTIAELEQMMKDSMEKNPKTFLRANLFAHVKTAFVMHHEVEQQRKLKRRKE